MSEADRSFFKGLARAAGAALFFALPLLMTMETWWLGLYLDRFRLLLLVLLDIPLLIGLSFFSGFKSTFSWRQAGQDAVVALGVGLAVGAGVLWLLNVINTREPADDVIGKIALQAVPASFGAVLANSQFSAEAGGKEREQQPSGYGAEVFLMVVGALFLAFNVAPTQEMMVLAYRLTATRVLLLVVVTLALMHAFVYAARFRGAPDRSRDARWWHLLLAYTAVGYVLALVVSAYVLWTFGRLQDHAFTDYVFAVTVLGFPAGLGAAAARLIV